MNWRGFPGLAVALIPIALASCGSSDQATDRTREAATAKNVALAKLELSSDAFENGQPIPVQYTCDGANRPPQLKWGEPPSGTRGFALIVEDPDTPGEPFGHWGVFDILPTERSLQSDKIAGAQATNDFGRPGYGSPCPPKGHGPHHYHFQLFALDTDKLGLPSGARIADVENAVRRHAIAKGELVAVFERR